MMNLRQLTYFSRVFEMRNITRAAQSLHVAQPALSQQIALLEDDLGVKLLVRTPKGVSATAEGTLLYQHAQTILRQVDSTRSLMIRSEQQVSGKVSIGLASSTARILALPLMARAKREYPSIALEIVDIPSADLTNRVLQGRIDFSLSVDQQPISGLSRTPLLIEEMFLLTNPAWKLSKTGMGMADIANLPIILPSPPNTLRARVDYAFMQAGLTYNLFAEASTAAIVIPAVRAGLAATILPYSAAHSEITAGLITRHSLAFNLSREIVLCSSDSLLVSPAIVKVTDLCKSVVRNLVSEATWLGCRLLY
jgi:LysR family nitrogen assimilation transcriptional regulator